MTTTIEINGPFVFLLLAIDRCVQQTNTRAADDDDVLGRLWTPRTVTKVFSPSLSLYLIIIILFSYFSKFGKKKYPTYAHPVSFFLFLLLMERFFFLLLFCSSFLLHQKLYL